MHDAWTNLMYMFLVFQILGDLSSVVGTIYCNGHWMIKCWKVQWNSLWLRDVELTYCVLVLLYKGSQEALNQFLICQEAQPEPEAVPTEEARVRVSLLICCVCDYWNINNTTWAVWKHFSYLIFGHVWISLNFVSPEVLQAPEAASIPEAPSLLAEALHTGLPEDEAEMAWSCVECRVPLPWGTDWRQEGEDFYCH